MPADSAAILVIGKLGTRLLATERPGSPFWPVLEALQRRLMGALSSSSLLFSFSFVVRVFCFSLTHEHSGPQWPPVYPPPVLSKVDAAFSSGNLLL